MKISRVLAGAIAILIVAVLALWNTRSGQDWLLEKGVSTAMARMQGMQGYDGLRVFMCGTSSPLPDPNRAQACVAIMAGESLYLVDAGAGSAGVAALNQLPLDRLQGVFLTHYHSDHIAALPEFNLNSWVAGRREALTIYGPKGVSQVVDGFNRAYGLDFTYRVAHHGADLLPPELGPMQSSRMAPGTVLALGDLTVTSFLVDHDPIHPAVAYRFEYGERSVVVSGDTVVTPTLVEAATGADLLLHDVLSETILQTFEAAARGTRLEKIFHDIQDYHALSTNLEGLVEQAGVRQLAVYHLVPPPRNALFEKVFARDLPDGTVITRDAMMFELPAGSDEIVRIDP